MSITIKVTCPTCGDVDVPAEYATLRTHAVTTSTLPYLLCWCPKHGEEIKITNLGTLAIDALERGKVNIQDGDVISAELYEHPDKNVPKLDRIDEWHFGKLLANNDSIVETVRMLGYTTKTMSGPPRQRTPGNT